MMWMGLDKTWKQQVKRSAPITPEILGDIRDVLDLNNDLQMVFWAACVTAFFILARKSNLVPTVKFEPNKQLATKHVRVMKNKLEITLHWTKTRRMHEPPIVYPLHKIPHSRDCPFEAITKMFNQIKRRPEDPCFLLNNGKPLTYRVFQKMLREALQKAGYPTEQYSAHGLWAGGASWAARAGVPSEMIRLLAR